jgi:hypothetical protein
MTMSRFSDQLFDDLVYEHGQELRTLDAVEHATVSARRHHRPLWLGVAAVVTGGCVATGLLLAGSSGSPAYAISRNPDGSVTITIDKASGIGAANQDLANQDLPVVVVPVRDDCPSLHSIAYAMRLARESLTAGAMVGNNGSGSVTVDVQAVAASGTTAVAAFLVNPDGSRGGEVAFVTGTPPSCVSLP